MKNANIIISVLIVLCIASGVTAYGILNPEENLFTNLVSFTPSDNPSNEENGEDTGDGSGKSRSNSGTQSNGGSSGISSVEAKNIASDCIKEQGCYAGNPKILDYSGNWYVPVLDNDGNTVDGIEIDFKTGEVIGRA
jgi:hypothetical protein